MSKTVRLWILFAMLAWVTYPLAYAPTIRLLCGADHTYIHATWAYAENRWAKVGCVEYPPAPHWTVAFLPVQFLSTHTPFCYPLQLWAEFWEVDSQQNFYGAD